MSSRGFEERLGGVWTALEHDCRDDVVLGALRRLLQDGALSVRVSAACVLCRWDQGCSIEVLKEGLQRGTPEDAKAVAIAIQHLGRHGAPLISPVLAALKGDSSSSYILELMRALVAIGQEAEWAILQILNHRNVGVQSYQPPWLANPLAMAIREVGSCSRPVALALTKLLTFPALVEEVIMTGDEVITDPELRLAFVLTASASKNWYAQAEGLRMLQDMSVTAGRALEVARSGPAPLSSAQLKRVEPVIRVLLP